MRVALRVFLFLSIAFVLACQAPVAAPPSTSPVGLSGGPLVDGVSVVVVDESTGAELSGATVACGDTTHTTTAGAAVRCEASGVDGVTLVVSAPGRVTERWIGVTRAHAVVASTERTSGERTLHGAITGAASRVSIGVSSTFGILRSGDPTRGAVACVDASDCTLVVGRPVDGRHDAAVIEHGAARLTLVRDVAIDAAGGFAIDVSTVMESDSFVALAVTLPGGEGLTEVVGVPGLSTENGVSLLGSLSEGTSTSAPAREGSLADDRLWFVAHARTADGTGESFALDRDIPVGETAVDLPSTFLAVPVASRAGDVVTITTDGSASLHVVESSDASGVVERAVVFTGASTLEVPVTGTSVRVRAVDASFSGEIDLGLVSATTTRFADRAL